MKRLSVVLIGRGLFAISCGGGEPLAQGEGAPPAGGASQLPPLPSSSVRPEGQAADWTIASAASELSRELARADRLASVEVLEGDHIVVHWDGPVDSQLQHLLNRFPGLKISVQTTSCSPGRLRDYGSELLASDPAVNIVSVSPDGSSLHLALDESVKATSDVAGLERKYSEAAGCPVKVEFGDVVPAGP